MKNISERMFEHWKESTNYFHKNNIVILCCQGSQNYGLETEESDLDTKLIITPSFKDIAMNKKPISTTHVRENEEHIDFKDIRLYIQTFRKQNLNFLEILFTPYYLTTPMYDKQWQRLVKAREDIAHMNPCRAVHSMKGIAMEKYHALEHPYPTKLAIINKHGGYDPKQLHHLLRIEDYLERYIKGESYEECLRPRDPGYLIAVKKGKYDLETAREVANKSILHVADMTTEFLNSHKPYESPQALELLEDVQYEIMRISVKRELK